MLVSALAVSFGLLRFDPQMSRYVGLSSVLHGLLVAGSRHQALRREPVGLLVLIAVAPKLIWEQVYGPMPASEGFAGGKVIVNAYVYGAIGGLVSADGHWLNFYWLTRLDVSRCWTASPNSPTTSTIPSSPPLAPAEL